MQLLGDAADNPDQRIAEDIRLFIEADARCYHRPRLAELDRDARIVRRHPLDPVGAGAVAALRLDLNIPGYLVWAALIYAVRRHGCSRT